MEQEQLYPILSYHILSSAIISYPIMPYHIISYHMECSPIQYPIYPRLYIPLYLIKTIISIVFMFCFSSLYPL